MHADSIPFKKSNYDVSVDDLCLCYYINVYTHTWPTHIPVPKGKFISETDHL